MDLKTTLAISVPIFVAVVGYLGTYVNNIRQEHRKNRLKRVENQLRSFYGPLFSLSRATAITWEGFVVEHRKKGLFGSGSIVVPESEAETKIWRHWMREVFMPINFEIVEIIVKHADLLEEEEMPNCLLILCAHVNGYKALLKSWEEENYENNVSIIPFPGQEIMDYTQHHYSVLKKRQAKLIGHAE